MRKIFYITLVTLLFSCSKNNEQEKTIYDFGMVEYEEPFRGILKSQPSILKQSLKYPPYKWLAPDTMSLQKTFIVDFNEDAVRSNAKATLYFVDLNNSPLDGVSFRLADGSISENLVTIIADSLHKEITIICDIHPSIGEQVKTGKITIAGNDLDQINSSSLQQDHMMLAEWKVEQKLNIPWLLWLLWLTTVIIIIVVAIVIVKFIIVVAAKAAKYILCFMSTSFVAIDYSLGAPLSITEGGKGRWTGRRGDSTYIFDLKQRPKTTNYGNMNNQTFGELGKDLGDSNPQVKYRKGFPVFDRDPATKSKRPLEVSFREGIGPYLKKKSNGTVMKVVKFK